MGFMARWAFSYAPLWGHLILANPNLAAIQGRTAAGARHGHPRGSETKLCIVFWDFQGFLSLIRQVYEGFRGGAKL